jgi:hypothetical protein
MATPWLQRPATAARIVIVRHLALVEEAVEAVRQTMRLCPEDERLREEERQLLDLQVRIEERLAVLAA